MAPITTSLMFGASPGLATSSKHTPGEEYSDADEDYPAHSLNRHTSQASPTPDYAHSSKPTIESDERIKELKMKGFSDQIIADKLTMEGHRILAKTVTGRWRRIRAAMEKDEEERMDDELSDWHVGEDNHLEAAYNAADQKFRKDLAKLEEQKWKDVGNFLAQTLDKKKYTAKACKDRYEALQDGTAEVPFEEDPDVRSRIKRRNKRIADNKRRRAEARVAAAAVEEEKKQVAAEEKKRKLDHRRSVLGFQAQKKAEKAEDKRIKKEAAEQRENERKARIAARQRLRDEAAERKFIKEAEERVYRFLTGRELARRHRKRDRKGDADDESVVGADDDDMAEYEFDYLLFDDEDDAAASSDNASEVEIHGPEKKKRIIFFEPAPITKYTLLNPRSIMSDSELDTLLYERKLPRRATGETHPEIIARFCAADNILESDEVNSLLEKHFIKPSGSLDKRIKALQKADAEESLAGRKGFDINSPEFKDNYEAYRGQYAYMLVD